MSSSVKRQRRSMLARTLLPLSARIGCPISRCPSPFSFQLKSLLGTRSNQYSEEVEPDIAPGMRERLQNRKHQRRHDKGHEDVQRIRERHRPAVPEIKLPQIPGRPGEGLKRLGKRLEKTPPAPVGIVGKPKSGSASILLRSSCISSVRMSCSWWSPSHSSTQSSR